MSEEKKSKKELQKEREDRRRRRDEFIERKAEKARQNDTRVIATRSEDVAILVNLLEQTDMAIIRMRKHIGGNVKIDDAMSIIDRFEEAILSLQEITKDAMELTKSNYSQPRTVAAIEERRGKKIK